MPASPKPALGSLKAVSGQTGSMQGRGLGQTRSSLQAVLRQSADSIRAGFCLQGDPASVRVGQQDFQVGIGEGWAPNAVGSGGRPWPAAGGTESQRPHPSGLRGARRAVRLFLRDRACVLSRFSPVRLFCDPVGCSPPGSSVQTRILEWVAMPCSRGSSWSQMDSSPPEPPGAIRDVWSS